jgi:hypothetical protein
VPPDERRICYQHDTIQGDEYLIFNLQSKKQERISAKTATTLNGPDAP